MDKLIIDGIEVEPDPSKTVLEVARELGIHIPTLCYHPALPPYGSCRLCVVEAIWKGKSTLRTACTFPAWEGEVRTNSEPVKRARRLILELMLVEAPASPEIQELAKEYGVETSRFKIIDEKKRHNRCIQCGLCVRICQDVMKVGSLGFKNRGFQREVTTPFEELSDVCATCGACEYVCPTNAISLDTITQRKPIPIPSEFEAGLGYRTPIYVPFPQAVPNTPVIDRERCPKLLRDNCGVCEKVCTRDAIDYQMQDEIIEAEVGAIVVATGYDLYNIGKEQPNELWKGYGEYNYDAYKDVIDGIQFERLLSASGPTQGEVRRPSDGKEPKSVVFIACVGSRDPEKGLEYCSKICCMYVAKHAMLYKHKVHDGQPYVFYMDIRAGGKNYEEFVRRAIEEDGVLYIRGRVSKIYKDGDQLVVVGADTLSDSQVQIRADLVVLATAMVPHKNAYEFAQKIGIACGSEGFYAEAHPKLRPVETMTAGIYLAGACQAPKDIPDAVAQASAAASKVQLLFSSDELEREPIVAKVNEETCVHCRNCILVCPYSAIDDKEIRDKQGNLIKMVAEVNEGMCMGCGTCVAACPSKSVQLAGFNDEQVFAEILALGHG